MSNLLFRSVKYVFRTLHMMSFAFLFGNYSYDYYFGPRQVSEDLISSLRKTNISMGIILVISGFINMLVLLKEKNYVKNTAYKVWRRTFEVMFCVSLVCFTPLFDIILKKLGNENKEQILKWKIFIMAIIFVLSPFLRFYREYNMKEVIEPLNTEKGN